MALERRAIIDALRAAARRAPEQLTARQLSRDHHALYRAALRIFGSIEDARRACGIAAPERRRWWTRARVVEELRRAARSRVRVTANGLVEAGRADLLSAARARFGGLAAARAAAAIAPPRAARAPRGTWSATRVTAEIRALHARGMSLASSRVSRALHAAACVHLGSWRRAVESIGVRYEDVRLTTRVKDQVLLGRLRALAIAKPHMSRSELQRESNVGAWRRRFGSVAQALVAAGLKGWPVAQRRPGSRAAVIEGLRRRRAAGRSTTFESLRREAPLLGRQVARYFRTFDAARRAAGIVSERVLRKRRIRAMLLLALVRRARRGLPMNPYGVERDEPSLYRGLRRHFGSYRAAAACIGY